MMRLFSIYHAPADDDATPAPSSEPGNPGPTMLSRLGEALSGMGPADAADTGGAGIDPTVILSPGGNRTVSAGEHAYRAEVPPGGPADNEYDEDASLVNRRFDDIIDPPGAGR